MKYIAGLFLIFIGMAGCGTKEKNIPVIAFVDAFEDNTLAAAKKGFFDALRDSGYDEGKKTIEVIYRNAQGSIPTLTQIINYFNAQKPTLIAACPTLSTITAVQNAPDIPIFMMVAGTPENMNVLDESGKEPKNLFGVAEELDYIDTSFLLIKNIIRPKSDRPVTGMIFNQAEPQSVKAIERIRKLAAGNNIELIALPVNSSADVQLVTESLLSKNIDVFFANPDNTVFSGFETINRACNNARVPIITSEAGLVERGALAAYGADIYLWGYQSGLQAARFLKSKSTKDLKWELVKIRKRVYNKSVAAEYNITMPAGFEPIP